MDGERPQHLPTTVSLNPWPITPIFECPPTRRTSRTRSSQCSTIATLKALLRSSLWRDTTSGRRSWRDREIGRLLETADAGDVLVAAEVSRLARSTLQVLELLQAAADRGVTVHIAKNRMVLDQSLPATITATILGLAAQIEREFISARTKEALERRKAAGLPVGRPKGRATKLMLDDRRAEIVDYLNKGVSKRSVAKILGCSPTTLYSWIRRRRISGR